MLTELEKQAKQLNHLKNQRDKKKLELETQKLELKYSDDYQQYKTIKEKEERAELAVKPLKEELNQLYDDIRKQTLRVELIKLEYELISSE